MTFKALLANTIKAFIALALWGALAYASSIITVIVVSYRRIYKKAKVLFNK